MTLILQLVQLARHIIGIIYLTTPSVAQGTQVSNEGLIGKDCVQLRSAS